LRALYNVHVIFHVK